MSKTRPMLHIECLWPPCLVSGAPADLELVTGPSDRAMEINLSASRSSGAEAYSLYALSRSSIVFEKELVLFPGKRSLIRFTLPETLPGVVKLVLAPRQQGPGARGNAVTRLLVLPAPLTEEFVGLFQTMMQQLFVSPEHSEALSASQALSTAGSWKWLSLEQQEVACRAWQQHFRPLVNDLHYVFCLADNQWLDEDDGVDTYEVDGRLLCDFRIEVANLLGGPGDGPPSLESQHQLPAGEPNQSCDDLVQICSAVMDLATSNGLSNLCLLMCQLALGLPTALSREGSTNTNKASTRQRYEGSLSATDVYVQTLDGNGMFRDSNTTSTLPSTHGRGSLWQEGSAPWVACGTVALVLVLGWVMGTTGVIVLCCSTAMVGALCLRAASRSCGCSAPVLCLAFTGTMLLMSLQSCLGNLKL